MIRCQKCGAGHASIEPLTEILASGTTLQTVRCILCGWRVSRQVMTMPAMPIFVENSRRPADAHKLPCAVQECRSEYLHSDDALPMCWRHRKRLQDWQMGQRTRPAPIQLINGIWRDMKAPRTSPQGDSLCRL